MGHETLHCILVMITLFQLLPPTFDFESFLMALIDSQDSEAGVTDIDAVVGDRISSVPRLTVSGSRSSLRMETDSIQESTVHQPLPGSDARRQWTS